MAEQKTLEGHEFGTMEIGWSPDNSKLVSVGQDGFVKIWNVNNKKLSKHWKEEFNGLSMSWSPDR